MSKFCPHCGAERLTTGAYCAECGDALDGTSRRVAPLTVASLTPKQGWVDYLLRSWHGNQLIAAAVTLFGIRVYMYWPFTWSDGNMYTHLASWAKDVDSIMLAALIPFLFTASTALSLYNWRKGTKTSAWVNVGLLVIALVGWTLAASHVMNILIASAADPYADEFAIGSAFWAIPLCTLYALGLASPLRKRRYDKDLENESASPSSAGATEVPMAATETPTDSQQPAPPSPAPVVSTASSDVEPKRESRFRADPTATKKASIVLAALVVAGVVIAGVAIAVDRVDGAAIGKDETAVRPGGSEFVGVVSAIGGTGDLPAAVSLAERVTVDVDGTSSEEVAAIGSFHPVVGDTVRLKETYGGYMVVVAVTPSVSQSAEDAADEGDDRPLHDGSKMAPSGGPALSDAPPVEAFDLGSELAPVAADKTGQSGNARFRTAYRTEVHLVVILSDATTDLYSAVLFDRAANGWEYADDWTTSSSAFNEEGLKSWFEGEHPDVPATLFETAYKNRDMNM